MNVTANGEFRIFRYIDVDQRWLLTEIAVDVAQYLFKCNSNVQQFVGNWCSEILKCVMSYLIGELSMQLLLIFIEFHQVFHEFQCNFAVFELRADVVVLDGCH